MDAVGQLISRTGELLGLVEIRLEMMRFFKICFQTHKSGDRRFETLVMFIADHHSGLIFCAGVVRF